MPDQSVFDPDHLYFVTTSAIGHLHLFESDTAKCLIVDCLHFLRTSGRMKLFAFVVMPNHAHVIGRFSAEYTFANMVRDFKRYTARQTLAELKARDNIQLLSALRGLNTDRRQEYKVWEDGYDSRDLFSTEMLQQKMDYIHLNPCQPQWKLVEDPMDYIWSSARFYMADLPAIIPVDDVREFLS